MSSARRGRDCYTSTTLGMVGSTSFFLKRYCSETIRSGQICVAGERNCPPEDCGGPHGFAELLEVLQNPSHPEHDDISEWVGEDFAPEYFTADEVNRKLNRRKHRVR